MNEPDVNLCGIDFSSSPSKKKPIAMAVGRWQGDVVLVEELVPMETLGEFSRFLHHGPSSAAAPPLPYVAAIDMPFGLSRDLVNGLGWPGQMRTDIGAWADLIGFYGGLTREQIRTTFKAWCDARPAGKKFAHRRTDGPAGSSPSMKWVNPPVAYMLHAGAPLLLDSGVYIPWQQEGDANRVVLEAYPGYFARLVLGRQSYKNDDPSKDSPDRRMARSELLCALEEGMLLGIKVRVRPYLRARLLEDSKADFLDALLCVVIAAHTYRLKDSGWGMPRWVDPVEGWIAGIPEKL